MFENTNRESMLTSLGMGAAVEKAKLGCCASCGNSIGADEFRNEISLREFNISGLCQICQDSIFGED